MEHSFLETWTEIQPSHSGWLWARLALSSIADSGVFIGAIGAVGCGVLAWTYQAGSARIGVVDLLACEIATFCRVAAVIDMVQRYNGKDTTGPEWEKAKDIAAEVMKRYAEIFPGDVPPPTPLRAFA